MGKRALALCLTVIVAAPQLTWVAHAQTTGWFTLQRWATQQGNLIDGMLWFVGDLNGNGKDDLADRWNDVGKFTIDAFIAHVAYVVYLPVIMR